MTDLPGDVLAALNAQVSEGRLSFVSGMDEGHAFFSAEVVLSGNGFDLCVSRYREDISAQVRAHGEKDFFPLEWVLAAARVRKPPPFCVRPFAETMALIVRHLVDLERAFSKERRTETLLRIQKLDAAAQQDALRRWGR